MKDIKVGDEAYKAKRLKKLVGWVRTSVEEKYLKSAKKRGWSKVQLVSWILKKHAPK